MKVSVCPSPVFVVGSPGSGSGEVFRALISHGNLWGGERGEFLAPLIGGLEAAHREGTARGRLQWLASEYVGRDEMLEHVGVGINALYTAHAGGRRWVDHSPGYGRHLDRLSAMFPDGRFVFVVRDGREAATAMQTAVPGLAVGSAAYVWRRYAEACLRGYAGVPGERMRMVRWAELRADPAAGMADLLDFLGEPYESGPAAVVAGAAEHAGSGWAEWSAGDRASFHRVAGDLLGELGFATDDGWVSADEAMAV